MKYISSIQKIRSAYPAALIQRSRLLFRAFGVLVAGLLLLATHTARAQVSGTIFRDYNANGIKDNANEPGVASLTVTATFNGTVATAISTTAGSYSFPVAQIPNATRVRLEFSGLPVGDFSGPFSAAGAGNGTSVQFVTAGASTGANINFGVHLPNDYCQPIPIVYTPCFVAGQPTEGTNVGDQYAIVGVNYNGTGAVVHPATASDVGSVWGLAYHRASKQLFSASMLKRHVGLGPLGIGGIYLTNTVAGTTEQFANLQGLNGIELASPSNLTALSSRGLPTVSTTASRDAAALALVGKVGFGGLALNETEDVLWAINLYQKTLVRINVGPNPATKTITAADVQSYPIPDPGCTNGTYRPWAVTFHNGKLYVGVVCDAGNAGGTDANLKAHVYTFNLTTNTFSATPIFSITNMAYPKGAIHTDDAALGDTWEPWRDTWADIHIGDASTVGQRAARTQPILSDITFDDDGSMVLAFCDRGGHQLGVRQQRSISPDDGIRYNGYVGGDVLRAQLTGPDTFTLENNGTSGGRTGFVGNSQGPGGGEFFGSDTYPAPPTAPIHTETSMGAVLIQPGKGELTSMSMDPLDVWTGGINWMSTTNGSNIRRFEIYQTISSGGTQVNGSGGKANGLGAVKAACNLAPIEIGNRVWRDDNRNGVQDPTEAGVAGVTVTLYKSTSLVATAVTNADGEYYFSSSAGTNTASAIYSLTALTPGSAVQLRINQGQAALTNFSLSPTNAGTNDGIDNDFALSGAGSTTAVANVTLGVVGQNVHTFDAGVFTCPTIAFSAPASATSTPCANTTLNMSVTTNAISPDQIRFVYFTEPLASPADAYTATGGTVLGTVTSGTATGPKTVTLPNVLLPDNVGTDLATLYVYAILASADGVCQPVAQRVIGLKPRPLPTIDGDNLVCRGSTVALTASGEAGTTFQWFLNNGTVSVSADNPYTTPAISATTTYRVRATLDGCVSDDAEITLVPVTCTPCVAGTGTVGGNVFRDFNSNGTNDTEPGMGAITVTIFRCDAGGSSVQVAQMLTDIKGQYSFTGLTGGTDYRVEFSGFPTGYEPTYRGTNNGTTVQFTRPGSCTTSLGLNQPNDYCQTNPDLATSCYVNGATTNTTAPRDVLVSFKYNNSGISPAPTHLAFKDEIGSTWGLAYNRYLKRLYTATFLKRQVGMKDADGNGTADPGVIWVTNPATAASQVWADLAKAPYNLNVGQIGNDAQRGLGAPNAPALDAEAFSKVNKTGLGDLEISDDGRSLYVVNLKTKTLHQIAINPDGSAGAMTTLSIPSPCGVGYNKLNIDVGATRNTGGFVTGWKADGYFISSTLFTTSQTTLPYTNGRSGAVVAYKVPVDNGTYNVTLYFGNNATVRGQTNEVEGSTQSLTLPANGTATQTFTVTVSDEILDIQAVDVAGGAAAAVLSGIDITPTSGQVFRENAPFALKFKENALYVGVTCTGEYSQNVSDLQATVYRLPVGSGTFTPVFSLPLDYPKGPSFANVCPAATGWFPWTSVESTVCATYPSPTLADIEFDVDGSMILGFMDRYAHQVGWNNINMADGGLTSAVSGGDILRVDFNNGVYTLENNGRAGSVSGGVNNNDGPGGGEFYSGEQITAGGITPHQETAQGGLSLLPGSGQVALISMDPVDGPTTSFATGGVIWLSNTNGAKQRSYQIFSAANAGTGTLAKANGLGDLELFCDLAPIQIGNRVWRDDNRNGIQDPCEPAIPGAVVKLYNATKTTELASVTTNAAGEYYFSSATVVAGTSTSAVTTTALQANTTYGLVISSLGTSTVVTSQGLTLTDVSPLTPGESGTVNSGTTQVNNDAKLDVVGGISLPCIKLTTGGPGESNHTYDFGIAKFVCSLTLTASASSQTACTNQAVVLTATTTPAGSYTYAWSGPAGTTITNGNTATATVTSSASGLQSFTVTVSSTPTCFTTTTVSVSVVVCTVPPASLGDFVWYDTNRNGQQDTGETGVPGVVVKLYNPLSSTTTPVASLTTDTDGKYLFTNLTPGVYCVIFDKNTLPTGYTLTAANSGTDATDSDADLITGKTTNYTLAAGETNLTVDAGLIPACVLPTNLSVVSSCVSATNGSGQIVATANSPTGSVEYRINGGTYQPAGVFSNLTNGTYTIEARIVGTTAPACSLTTTATVSCNCIPPTLTLQSPPTTLCAPATLDLTGTSIILANTGVRTLYYTNLADANAGGSAGQLANPQAVTASGTYYIRSETSDIACFAVKPVSVTIVDCRATLGDKVFADNNGNGIQDVGDTPIPGVTVTLISNGTVVTTTTTASSGTAIGCYSFTGLTPGVPYSVSFTTPPGFTATTPLSGTDKTNDSDPVGGITAPVTLTAGENNPTLDAGFTPLLGSLGDLVWKDVNRNGQYDAASETGVASVTVSLLAVTSPVGATVVSTSVVSTTTTDANGKYLFSGLPAGRYIVVFEKTTLPPNCVLSPDYKKAGVAESLDSDADPQTGRSPIVELVLTDPAQRDILTVDAALVVPDCPPAKCIPLVIRRNK